MKKSAVRILFALIAAVLMTAVLAACSGETDSLKFSALSVVKNGQTVEEITFTEGEKIAYADYSLLIYVSDGSSFTAPLAERHFDAKEIADLYTKKGDTQQTMKILYQDGVRLVQGLIVVRILKPYVEETTYTVKYVMERDFAAYTFAPTTGVARITSLPERHTAMPQYFRIEWRTVLDDPSTKIVLPYRLSSDLTIYGKVADDRNYTVRFWKDFDGTNYANQVGADVSNVKFDDRVNFPTEGYEKVGYRLVEWARTGTDFSDTEKLGGYFYVKDEFVSGQNTQIINVYAVYTVNRYEIRFRYENESGELTAFPQSFGDYSKAHSVDHGASLSIGAEFSATDAALVFTEPPFVLGEGYRGSWYYRNDDDAEVPFTAGETRLARGNLEIYAKYEKLTLNVRFFNFDRTVEMKAIQIEYGAVIPVEDYPAHNAQDGYRFEWDGGGVDMTEGVTKDFDIYETRIALNYQHRLYYDTAAGRQFEAEESAFNTDFYLWDLDKIKAKLGNDYKAYFEYRWYATDTANPETDAPLALSARQTAGTMSFYLKTKDLRRYTVYYYTKLGSSGDVTQSHIETETVRFAENADFDAGKYPVNGWSAQSIVRWDDLDSVVSTGLGFVPSDLLAGDKTQYEINVVVLYARNNYRLELYEPVFGTTEKSLYASVTAEYETVLNTIEAIKDYRTEDRVTEYETYRFYGWYLGDKAIDPAATELTTAMSLDAKWVALSEGTYGIRYESVSDSAGSYAVAVGYTGEETELIFGSKYVANGVTLPVKKIGIVVSDGKNRSVKKVSIPSTVEAIAPAAFIDFYGVVEFETEVGSATFTTRDGVLYSAGTAALVAYPRMKRGDFVVPKEVQRIAESAFLGFSAEQISFESGSSLKTLGKNSFANALGMKTIMLPEGLEAIESGAFDGCAALLNVVYGGTGLKTVGEEAFVGTEFYDKAADGALMLGGVLLKIVGAVDVDYVLDDGVTAIAAGAFDGAGVKTVTAGESSKLAYVGDGKFANLESFTIESAGVIVEFDKTKYVFDGTAMGFHIFVPPEKLAEYEAEYRGTEYDGDFSAIV